MRNIIIPVRRRLAFVILAILVFPAYTLAQQLIHDPNLAFSAATRTGKDVLLIFSGSDWCVPCIRFEKKILTDTAFQLFASAKLIILEADFPQRKKIPDTLRTAYEALADKFNAEGDFPRIVLLSPHSRLLATLPFTGQSTAEFISAITAYLSAGEK